MADFPPPQQSAVLPATDVPTTAALIAYALFGFAALTQIGGAGLAVPAPLLTLIGVVGVIVAYVKRGEARGSWLESHMTQLISVFWWSTIWAAIGWVLFITILGIPFALAIWAIVAVWVLYRVIRGVLYLKDQRAYPR